LDFCIGPLPHGRFADLQGEAVATAVEEQGIVDRRWGSSSPAFFPVRMTGKYRHTRWGYCAMVELLNTLLSMLVSFGFAVLVLISLLVSWSKGGGE
jgi:hypothetical protein